MKPIIAATKAARHSQKKLAGCAVVICRKVDDETVYESGEIIATLGETSTEESFESGVVISSRLRDFLIDAADYKFEELNDGNPVKPECGDVIKVCLESGDSHFKVVPVTEDRAFERSDRWGIVWRIHTKEIFNEKGWY